MAEGKPHFFLPTLHDSEYGWGPASDIIPTEFRDIPYAPYSKADKLGRVADWTNPDVKNKIIVIILVVKENKDSIVSTEVYIYIYQFIIIINIILIYIFIF